MKFLLLALLPLCLVATTACTTGVSDTSPSMQGAVHNSRNSLDWAGVYEGTLPCADCPGIATRVDLAPDETYILSIQYLDRDPAPRLSLGTFKWDAEGRSI